MNLSDTLFQAFNTQYNTELTNSDAYRQLANCLDAISWPGFVKFLRHASDEERGHATKFEAFLLTRNRTPLILARSEQTVYPTSPQAACQLAYGLEQQTTQRILQLHHDCEVERDFQAQYSLIWALDEQAASEHELVDLLQELDRATGDNAALRELDRRLLGD